MASPEMIQRVLAIVSKDIIVADDSLRVIADELDRLNKPWQDEIDKQMTLEQFIERQIGAPAGTIDILHVNYADKDNHAS